MAEARKKKPHAQEGFLEEAAFELAVNERRGQWWGIPDKTTA